MAWYTVPSGATCVWACDAIGAASLADSYVNEANPGVNNAAPGVAPTWAYGTGWTFNGSTQYLTTGIIPTWDYSMVIRYSGASGTDGRHGALSSFVIIPRFGGARFYQNGGGSLSTGTAATSGVIAMAGKAAYHNAASDGTISAGTSSPGVQIYIGARNNNPAAATFATTSIAAVAIYSSTITAADVTALTAAMNALPVAASAPTMMQHHHAMLANRR